LYVLWDLAKILGGVVRDTLDVGDYRITLVVERKVDDKMGVVVESMSIDKRMNMLEVEMFTKKLKEFLEKK